MTTQDAEFFTIQEVADLLRVNHKTIREEIRRGRIPCVRMGRVMRIARSVVDSLTQGRVALPEGRPVGG